MKNLKSLIGISLLFLFLSSCVTFADFDRSIAQWKGQDEDQLYQVFGPPMRSQTLNDGRKLVAYDYSSSGTDGPWFCELNFTIQESKVTQATYKGDYSALIEHLRGIDGEKVRGPEYNKGESNTN